MCEHNELCRAMALCDGCFDAKEAEGATQVASPPKKRKTGGGHNKLNFSPADKLKHDNKRKLDSSRRKRAKVKADNVTLLKLQHECGRLRQEKDELLAENRNLKLMVDIHDSILDSVRVHAALNSYTGILEVRTNNNMVAY